MRSPYNLCLDAGLVVLTSYAADSARRWLSVQQGRGPTEQFSMWWALNEASGIAEPRIWTAERDQELWAELHG